MCLVLFQVGEVNASPYNPTQGNAADRLYVKCVGAEEAAAGIKSFSFSWPEPAGRGKRQPFDYLPGQYGSFDFQVMCVMSDTVSW